MVLLRCTWSGAACRASKECAIAMLTSLRGRMNGGRRSKGVNSSNQALVGTCVWIALRWRQTFRISPISARKGRADGYVPFSDTHSKARWIEISIRRPIPFPGRDDGGGALSCRCHYLACCNRIPSRLLMRQSSPAVTGRGDLGRDCPTWQVKLSAISKSDPVWWRWCRSGAASLEANWLMVCCTLSKVECVCVCVATWVEICPSC